MMVSGRQGINRALPGGAEGSWSCLLAAGSAVTAAAGVPARAAALADRKGGTGWGGSVQPSSWPGHSPWAGWEGRVCTGSLGGPSAHRYQEASLPSGTLSGLTPDIPPCGYTVMGTTVAENGRPLCPRRDTEGSALSSLCETRLPPAPRCTERPHGGRGGDFSRPGHRGPRLAANQQDMGIPSWPPKRPCPGHSCLVSCWVCSPCISHWVCSPCINNGSARPC